MATIKVKQVKSAINRPSRQKKTLQALGLKKLTELMKLIRSTVSFPLLKGGVPMAQQIGTGDFNGEKNNTRI